MSCCDARSTLPLLLDEQLAAGDRAAAMSKAMACGLCRAELAAMAQNDAALRHALAAQVGQVGSGYFDDFWPRLAARLDGEILEGESMRTSSSSGSGDSSVATPPPSGGDLGKDVAGKPMSKDEFSGLHEIKALAANAVRRSTQLRAESEPGEDSDALLAAPAALSSVVLPQPGKEVAPPKVRAASVADADGVVAASLSQPVVVKHSRAGLVVGVMGVLVAAGAIGLYVMNGRSARDAAPQVAAVEPASANAPAPAPTPTAPAQPVATALAEKADEAKPAEPEKAAADEDKAVAKDTKDDKDAKKAAKDEKSADKGGDAIAAAALGKGGAAKDEKSKDAKEPAAKEAAPAAEPKPEGKPGSITNAPHSEIDDIFNDKPSAAAKPVAPSGPALPEKLSQEDVKKGMGSVKARVQACYDEFKVSGTIKLKVKIEADGSVSTADVVDQKFAATDTGACVAAAVKTAKFPAVSGTSLVVTYPFILQ